MPNARFALFSVVVNAIRITGDGVNVERIISPARLPILWRWADAIRQIRLRVAKVHRSHATLENRHVVTIGVVRV